MNGFLTALIWASAACFAVAFVLIAGYGLYVLIMEIRLRRMYDTRETLDAVAKHMPGIFTAAMGTPGNRRPRTRPRRTDAPPYGGLCVARHYVAPYAVLCYQGHSYSPAMTLGASRPELVAARDWAIRKLWVPASVPAIPHYVPLTGGSETDAQRGAAGGW